MFFNCIEYNINKTLKKNFFTVRKIVIGEKFIAGHMFSFQIGLRLQELELLLNTYNKLNLKNQYKKLSEQTRCLLERHRGTLLNDNNYNTLSVRLSQCDIQCHNIKDNVID